ncbi:oligosaccharide flippase family protein [Janibacter sp. CX7]|uniref:oligosaccharide flippase family protein n=1 Tax=Janibacter sp. CX7 TaxID=2963431 RepID=UPI0020CC9437|nr:oligosaccharide flippase family protein [Janibacter sp. CX7]UTT65363.1 oligosaccharide flippase family protein [Janibacter sp. CX7]
MTEPTESARTALNSAQLQDRAVKGVAWTMIHTIVSVPVAFAVNLLLARVLAPAGYGRLAFLTTLIGIASSIVALGLSSAMIQFGARAHAAGRTSEVRKILSASQGFRLLVVAPILTALIVFIVDVPIPLLVLAVAFGVWVPAALDGATITLSIENKSAEAAKIAMVSNVLVQAGVVGAVLWVGTADSVWAARVVLSAGVIAMAFVAISSDYRRAVLRPRLPKGFPAGFWRFAVPTGIAALIGDLALSRTEVVFLTWLSSPEQVGLYALAFGVSSHIFGPAHALTGPLIPAVSGLKEVGSAQVAEAFERALRSVAVVIAALTVIALPALAALVPLLYGGEYAGASTALLALGLVGGIGVLAGPISAFVMARLSARRLLIANAAALCADLVLAIALIPLFGMWGAVIANAGAVLVQLGVILESERQELGLSRREVARMLTPVLTAPVACGVAWSVVDWLPIGVLMTAVLSSCVSTLVLWIGLKVTKTGLRPQDCDAVVRSLPRRLVPAATKAMALLVRHDDVRS